MLKLFLEKKFIFCSDLKMKIPFFDRFPRTAEPDGTTREKAEQDEGDANEMNRHLFYLSVWYFVCHSLLFLVMTFVQWLDLVLFLFSLRITIWGFIFFVKIKCLTAKLFFNNVSNHFVIKFLRFFFCLSFLFWQERHFNCISKVGTKE